MSVAKKKRSKRRTTASQSKKKGPSKRSLVRHPCRKSMHEAIREMLESKSEHASKSDPLVGAVLIDQYGNTTARAHRGKYGTGDHGEFTLLEKPGVALRPGWCLYVTLEPCTTRGPRKTPCADRIIAAGIKQVVIGIRDPNPEIWGQGEAKLRQAGIQVDFFDSDLRREIETHNAGFIKEQEQRAKQFKEMKLTSADREENLPVREASVSDLSKEAIRLYLNKAGKTFSIPSTQLWNDFKKSGFLVEGTTKGELIPTKAGIILFATEPHQFLPEARIKANVFPGSPDDPMLMEHSTAQSDITGPLFTQVEAALRFFDENVRGVPRRTGIDREAVQEYPEAVMQEAIVNALAHRSYGTGAHTFLQMYRDRIIVRSPGLPKEPLTIDMFPDQVISCPRNSKIAQAAYVMGLMESRGFGIKSMPEKLAQHGLRDPRFSADKGYFVLTLFGRELTPFKVRADRQLLASLTSRQLEIVELAEGKQTVRSEDLVRAFGISKETASQDLRRLLQLKVFGKAGSGRSTSYYLIKR